MTSLWSRASRKGALLLLLCSYVSAALSYSNNPISKIQMNVHFKVNGQVGDQFQVTSSGISSKKATVIACKPKSTCSKAIFRIHNGKLDTHQSHSISGGYLGVDASGLFWSQSRQFRSSAIDQEIQRILSDAAADASVEDISYIFILEVDGQFVAHEIVKPRSYVKAGPVSGNEDRPLGKFYLPPVPGKYPVVIFFDGQPPHRDGNLMYFLALAGNIVIYADYWHESDSDDSICLANAKLDGFFFLIKMLRESPIDAFNSMGYSVESENIHIFGASRGAEAALWMSNIAPDMVTSLTLVDTPEYAFPGCVKGGAPWSLKDHRMPAVPAVESIIGTLYEDPLFSKKNQASFMREYYRRVKQAGYDLYQIPISCEVRTLVMSGRYDTLMDSRQFVKRFSDTCRKQENNVVLTLDAGHSFFDTPWSPACSAESPEPDCADPKQARIRQVAMNAFLSFISEEVPRVASPKLRQLGECRRSYESFVDGLSECALPQMSE